MPGTVPCRGPLLREAVPRESWGVSKVAAAFGMSVETLYVAKHRVLQLINEEVARLEKELT